MSVLPSWVLGIFVAFVLALVSLLGYFSPFIAIILTLLVSFPVIFASSLGHIASMNKEGISAGTQFKRGLSFFSINNSRCFRILPSMLFSLIVYFAVDVTATIVLIVIFNVAKPGLFSEIYNEILEFLTNPEILSYEEALGENIIYFNYYRLFTVVPSSICAVTFFIYRVSLNSLSLYSKKTFGDSPIIFAVNVEVFRRYKKEIRKDYLSLNFPLFILFFLFSVVTMILSTIYISIDAEKVNAISDSLGYTVDTTETYNDLVKIIDEAHVIGQTINDK